MNQFFAPIITDSNAILSETESLHLKVLRFNVGDDIIIVDGKGNRFKGKVKKIHKKATEITDLHLVDSIASPPLLDIAIAPTKSNDRFEWFLEKSTELGVRNIYPILTFHSERKILKIERMQKIILSAMKQSLRLWQPVLHDIQHCDKFLVNSDHKQVQKFIAHLKEDAHTFAKKVDGQKSCVVMIGPEGGFSEKEIENALSVGFVGVSLGSQRYRTETAGILTCALFANS